MFSNKKMQTVRYKCFNSNFRWISRKFCKFMINHDSELGQDSRPQRVVLVEVPEGCIIMVMHYLVYLKSLELLGLSTQIKNILLIW